MHLSRCPEPPQWESYLQGRLEPSAMDALESHLDVCPACQEHLRRQWHPAVPNSMSVASAVADQGLESEAGCRELVHWIRRLPKTDEPLELAEFATWHAVQTTCIGDYELRAMLGQGGMGCVYRAFHLETRRACALKVLTSDRMHSRVALRRFRREVEILRTLDHPRVVAAADAGEWRGVPFVVMRLLEGLDWSRLISASGPLSATDSAELLRQACEGLEYIHSRGLVHRDLKPSNLMLTQSGVCVLDLGLARATLPVWEASTPTLTGDLLGSVHCMSPEQFACARDVDARSDIYGLGCVWFFLLTGSLPYSGPRYPSAYQVMHGHTSEAPPEAAAHRSDLPAELIALLGRMLAKSPTDRPQNARELLDSLAPLAEGHAVNDLIRRLIESVVPADHDELATPLKITVSVHDEATLPVGAKSPSSTVSSRTRGVFVGGLILAACAAVLWVSRGWWGETAVRNLEGGGLLAPPISERSSRPVSTPPSGEPLGPMALVSEPATVPGCRSWTFETVAPRGHLYEIAISADGKRYATGDETGGVRVFDSDTDQLLRLFVVSSRVRSLDWSSSGPWLAIGCSEPETVVFDSETGRRAAHFRLDSGVAHCVRWSPDGRILASAGGKGFLLQEWQTGRSREVIVPDSNGVVSLSWSPDGAHVVTADMRGRCRIWNTADGSLVREIPTQSSRLAHVAFSPDGAAVSFAAENGPVQIASLQSDRVWSLGGHVPGAGPLQTHWLNGQTLLTTDGLTLRRFRVFAESGAKPPLELAPTKSWMNPLRIPHPIHGGGVLHRLAVSRDGSQVWCALRFARRVWRLNLTTDSQREVGPEQPTVGLDARVAWSPNGRWIAFAEQASRVRLLDTRTWEPSHLLPLAEPLGSLAWSPHDQRFAVVAAGQVSVFSKLDSVPERLALPACGSVTCSWSPDGRWLATSGWGDQRRHELRLLDTATWQVSFRVELAADAYLIHAWSPDSQWLACGTDQEVRLLEVAAREWKQSFAMGNRVNGLSWHPREQRLAAITFDGRPRVLAIETGEARALEALSNPATGLLWSKDGERILVEYGRDLACLDWPTGTVRWRQPLNGHSIESLAQSPDGTTLAVAVRGELRLHDSRTGRRMAVVLATNASRWLVLSPQGQFRGAPGIESDLLVVQESEGMQSTQTLPEFAARHGWTNDPTRVEVPNLNLGWHGWPAEAPAPASSPLSPDEVAWTLKYTEQSDEFRIRCIHSELPQHRVVLTQPFFLGKFEVTQAQFESVVGRQPSQFAPTGKPEYAAKVAGLNTAQYPVDFVSRNDAAEFCIQLSQRERLAPCYFQVDDQVKDLDGIGYRLPTEAEWECACRAGATTAFWSGPQEADFLRVGWGGTNSGGRTHPVGQLPANPLGLHDMHGNVAEWTHNAWDPLEYSRVSSDTVVNPRGTSAATRLFAVRGGSCTPGAMFCRASSRSAFDYSGPANDFGFRVALSVEAVRQAGGNLVSRAARKPQTVGTD